MFFGKDQLRDVEEEILARISGPWATIATAESRPRVLIARDDRRDGRATEHKGDQLRLRGEGNDAGEVSTHWQRTTCCEGLPSRVHEVYGQVCRRKCLSIRRSSKPDGLELPANSRRPSEAAAARSARLGVRPGDRVMVASENSVALARSCSPPASSMPGRSRPIRACRARELDQIRAHSGARACLLNSALSKEAADHADALGATTRLDRAVRRLGRRRAERGGAGRACEADAREARSRR